MNPADLDRFREVENIFYEALEREPGLDRDTLIRERCGADENLHTEVTLLLEDHARIRAAVPESAARMPRFGAWQAVKLLGRGGMGTVYLAERADGAFKMSAAVKVVPLALASHEIEERFRRERQFLAGLDHPKIARLIDGGVSDNGLPFLVMEFVGGLSVDRFCEAHQLDVRSRVALVRQVLDALGYVHRRQVIHRDIKPSNILVDESGSVKLLDFGTARLVDATGEAALTRTGVFAFTPEYASPEQVRGEPVTPASDLYSAGVLLYRLAAGRLPYRIADETPAAMAQAIARAEPEPAHIDAALDAVIRKALRKDAAARYQSAEELDADLARYLEGRRVRARKPRTAAWIAIGVAALLFALGMIGIRLWRAPSHPAGLVPFDVGVPDPMQPALSQDGRWLAFAVPGNGSVRSAVWLKRMPDGAPRRVTEEDSSSDEPALSPDGRWLAYHSTRSPAGVYLRAAANSGSPDPPRLLAEGGRVPRYSPDGRSIAYLNVGETGADPLASNSSMLFSIPSQGGPAERLARNVNSVLGASWTSNSQNLLFLAVGENQRPQLWSAPAGGGPAVLRLDFSDLRHGDGLACAVTGDRLLYTAYNTDVSRSLNQFLLQPLPAANRYLSAAAPGPLVMVSCTASASGTVVAGEVSSQAGIWTLPLDTRTGVARGPLAPLSPLRPGPQYAAFVPDGSAFLFTSSSGAFMRNYRTGAHTPVPNGMRLSPDGQFVLLAFAPSVDLNAPSMKVLDLKTGVTSGNMQTNTMPWSLSPGGQWMLAASVPVHRTILAWDTRTAEHQSVYAHPSANLYLANFSPDGRWVVFTSEQRGQHPRMWAAPFRDLESVPASDWIDLGEGDYPQWSPAGDRVYFTQVHEGFECIFTRPLDPSTKRPSGPVTAVAHLHGNLTIHGVPSGTFRLSVDREKLAFPLGQRVHRLFEWR